MTKITKTSFLQRSLSLFLFIAIFTTYSNAKNIVEKNNHSWFDKIEHWYSSNMNYGTITILMAAESSIFPVPSELVVPPAAYIASKEDSNLDMFWVIFFATIGAMIGAIFNYTVLGMWLGRSIIYKFADSKIGGLLLLSSEKLQKTETFFNKYGNLSTFIGRFIPVVRHFISIPAGFSKMNFLAFSFFTFAGAFLWNCILALMGYLAHGQQDLILRYSHEIGIAFFILMILIILFFIVKYFIKKNKKN